MDLNKFLERMDNIKLVFGDVDNTFLNLQMHDEDGHRIVGQVDYMDWLKFNIDTDAYKDCIAPKGMKKFIDLISIKAHIMAL